MNEDLANHPEDQLNYLTHWLDISQNSEKDKKHEFNNLKEIITRHLIGYALFAVRNLGGRYSDYWCWTIGKFGVIKIFFQEDQMRKKSW